MSLYITRVYKRKSNSQYRVSASVWLKMTKEYWWSKEQFEKLIRRFYFLRLRRICMQEREYSYKKSVLWVSKPQYLFHIICNVLRNHYTPQVKNTQAKQEHTQLVFPLLTMQNYFEIRDKYLRLSVSSFKFLIVIVFYICDKYKMFYFIKLLNVSSLVFEFVAFTCQFYY